jgi:rhodanese-related sulfurtransferase
MVTEFIQQNMVWVGLALVSGMMLLWPMLTGGGKDELTPAAATMMMNREDAVVVDVRDANDWGAGHIQGAKHIALAQLEKRVTELEKLKTTPVIVCCANGMRSSAAVSTLKKAGFEKVFMLNGGIAAWKEGNLPLTKKG